MVGISLNVGISLREMNREDDATILRQRDADEVLIIARLHDHQCVAVA
jgi:hypothetical protein